MKKLNNQHGFLILIAIALILLIGFIGVAATYLFTTNTRSGLDHYQSMQAFYLAQTGLEDATHNLLDSSVANRSSCTSPSTLSINSTAFTNATQTALGGAFTATATSRTNIGSSTCTLTSQMLSTASVTSIPVTCSTGVFNTYALAGRLMIDQELFNYTGASSNTFTGVTRAVDNSTAATHAAGTPIGQYQCAITAQGGVPNLNTPVNPGDPLGKRTLSNAIQLQDGWAVGDNSGGTTFNFIRWNNPTEVAWNSGSFTSGSDQPLDGVSMLSYVDGWAIGAVRSFLRWNGASWALQTGSVVSSIPSVEYFGIFCVASNNCMAVGTNSGAPNIVFWNGSVWNNATITGTPRNAILYGLHCNSPTNCWAVGERQSGNRSFYQGSAGTWVGYAQSSTTFPNGVFPFRGVFCISDNDCWAVGNGRTFARKASSSTTWTAVTTASIPAIQYNSIYCNNTNDCWAVGNSTTFARKNGANWSSFATGLTGTGYMSVTCANSNDCWAVGGAGALSGTPATPTGPARIAHWDGITQQWTNVSAPAGLASIPLNGISIISPHNNPQSAWQEN